MSDSNLNRRDFLKGAAALFGVLSLSGWKPGTPPPIHWVLEQSNDFYAGPWTEVEGWRGKVRYEPGVQPEGCVGVLLAPRDLVQKTFCRLRRTDREMTWTEQSLLVFYDHEKLKRGEGTWGKPLWQREMEKRLGTT